MGAAASAAAGRSPTEPEPRGSPAGQPLHWLLPPHDGRRLNSNRASRRSGSQLNSASARRSLSSLACMLRPPDNQCTSCRDDRRLSLNCTSHPGRTAAESALRTGKTDGAEPRRVWAVRVLRQNIGQTGSLSSQCIGWKSLPTTRWRRESSAIFAGRCVGVRARPPGVGITDRCQEGDGRNRRLLPATRCTGPRVFATASIARSPRRRATFLRRRRICRPALMRVASATRAMLRPAAPHPLARPALAGLPSPQQPSPRLSSSTPVPRRQIPQTAPRPSPASLPQHTAFHRTCVR